jgi:hypothetical protein
MKIYDCFTFNNELDALEVRLNELYPVVDHFVLVEASRTHAGQPKPLHFQEQRARFAPFADKLIYVPVYDLPDGDDAWVRENFQRNCIARGLANLRDDDLVLVSDADEIPRQEIVAELRYDRHDLFGLRLPLFYYRFNYVNIAGAELHQVWTVGVRGREFRSGQAVRNLGREMTGLRNWLRVKRQHGRIIPQAGWHFSWLGNEPHIARKLQDNAPHEWHSATLLERLDVERLMAERSDHFSLFPQSWEIVELDDYFPSYLVINRRRFASLIAPGAKHTMAEYRRRLVWEAHPLSRFSKVAGQKIGRLRKALAPAASA